MNPVFGHSHRLSTKQKNQLSKVLENIPLWPTRIAGPRIGILYIV